MAGGEVAPSFDDIIQADRTRRRNEKLAEEIFGKGRKATPSNSTSRNQSSASSFSSRAGVAKRSNSNTPKGRDISDALRGTVTRPPRHPRPSKESPITKAFKKDLLYDAATNKQQQSENGNSAEFNIRGVATGPYTVIGSNFAPGTTAADIESALLPFGGDMQSCRILTAAPTVMAEMIYSEKVNADSVISRFNNAKADGRLLHLYLHYGPPHHRPSTPTPQPAAKAEESFQDESQKDLMTSYANQREQSDRNRRRADPEPQGPSYGYDNKNDQMDIETDTPATQITAPTSTSAPIPSNASAAPIAPRFDSTRQPRHDNHSYGHRDYAPRRPEWRGYDDRYGDRGNHRGGNDRPRDDRRGYGDDMYRRPRGRGYH